MGTNAIEASKAVVREFLEVFSLGDIPGVLQRLHPEATWWVSGTLKGLSGTYTRQELGELLKGVKGVYKRGALRITPVSMIAEGNFVAVEAECREELSNGSFYDNRYHFLFEVEDGVIRRIKEYMDTAHAYATFLAPS
jgi:ketosteroid isomerase-like protein